MPHQNQQRTFKIAVIGSGPGGYVAAIRAAQRGAKVALIEGRELGGTCLNRGCIPTKALVASANLWEQIRRAQEFGIEIEKAKVNYSKMLSRKNAIVAQIRDNLKTLIASNKITLINGWAKFDTANTLKIFDGKGGAQEIIEAEKIIIATGSEPLEIPAFPFDHERVHCSTSLLEIKEIPQSIAIVGGGYIGCEFASIFSALGTKVTLIEATDRLIGQGCPASSAALRAAFEAGGIEILCNHKLAAIDRSTQKLTLRVQDLEQKKEKELQAEISLIAIGRKFNSGSLQLERALITRRENGSIPVNGSMQTETSHIYAIGDVTGDWLLAHTASHQAMLAADHALGIPYHLKLDTVPSVIFTEPEVASVGLHLEQAIEKGFRAKAKSFPFAALGKAHAAGHTEGFGQIVVEEGTERILGAQVVGHEAGCLIAEMALAISQELTLDSIHETVHAHPTISEVWLETAFLAKNTPLHLPPSPLSS